jgi:hypothetical protein
MKQATDRAEVGTAYLSVQVPRTLNFEHSPLHAPILLEAPTPPGTRIDLRADGRSVPVPSGLVYLTAKPHNSSAVTVAIELESGQSYHYRFRSDLFCDTFPKAFKLTTNGPQLAREKGTVFVRFLEGADMKPTQLSYLVRSSEDGGLSVSFAGHPAIPLMAEIVAPGEDRALLALSPEPGPGKLYTTVRLTVELHNAIVTINASDVDPNLALAWRSSLVGDFPKALHLVEPHLQQYTKEGPRNQITAAGVAYILIRAGHFDLLGPWALDLFESDKVRADGIVIASEWFANAGCHVSAMNLLRHLPRVGLPFFTDGYSLAIARLAAYGTSRFDRRSASRSEPSNLLTFKMSDSNVPTWQLYRELVNSRLSVLSPWIGGQELTSWNPDEARQVHGYLLKDVRDVDWFSYCLRVSRTGDSKLQKLFTGVYEWLETRLSPSWTALKWQIPQEKSIK